MRLSLPTLTAAIAAAGLGEPHPVLAGAERFISRRVRDEADRQIWAELKNVGLTRGNQLSEDFTEMLVAIQRGTRELYGWLTSPDGNVAVLAAAIGSDAVVLGRTDLTVHIERIKPDDIVGQFLAWLPETPPGHGRSLTMRLDEPARQGYMVPNRPASGDDRRKFVALLKEPRSGGGMIYGGRRDRTGARKRSTNWVTFVDTHSGRWVFHVTDGTVTAVPGTRRVLLARIAEL